MISTTTKTTDYSKYSSVSFDLFLFILALLADTGRELNENESIENSENCRITSTHTDTVMTDDKQRLILRLSRLLRKNTGITVRDKRLCPGMYF